MKLQTEAVPAAATVAVTGRGGGLRQPALDYRATRRALGFALSTQVRVLMDFGADCE